jgi:hypothetical protein
MRLPEYLIQPARPHPIGQRMKTFLGFKKIRHNFPGIYFLALST